MNIKKYVLGNFSTNCYAVSGEDFAFIIDPAGVCAQLQDFAEENKGKRDKYIFLTHCHIDHILGAEKFREIWNCAVVISEADSEGLKNPDINLSAMLTGSSVSIACDKTVKDGDEILIGDKKITVLSTPGHTVGSVCYLVDDFMFSGDTLFAGTIGRTDMPTASVLDMQKSLKKLAEISAKYKIYPGHGPDSTLNTEKNNNAYMRMF